MPSFAPLSFAPLSDGGEPGAAPPGGVAVSVAGTAAYTITGTGAVAGTVGSGISGAVAGVAAYTIAGTGAVAGTVGGAAPSGPLTDDEWRQMHTWVFELAKIHGLVAGVPLVVTSSARQAGDVNQTISEAGGAVTVARA